MNKSYKSVWNESTGSWVAVSELATGRSKSKRAKTAISKAILTQVAVGGMSIAGMSAAMASPDQVVNGQGATVNVLNGVAIGTDATVDAETDTIHFPGVQNGGLAVGNNSYASGSGVAIGENTSASSESLAFGYGATAMGGSTAIGRNSRSFNTLAVALGENASAGGVGSLALGANTQTLQSGTVALGQGSIADRQNTVSVGSAGSERQIVNVAAGTSDTDVVNVKQLKAAGLNIDTSGNPTNTFVAYSGTTKDLVSLLGTSGTKISNVSAGALTATSTEAVNGSQLFNVASSAAAALGGGSTLGPDGKIKAPEYSVGGTTYNDIGNALTAVEAMTGTASPDAVIYDTAAHDKLTLGKTGGAPVTVTNVAAGVAPTDAVNMTQFNGLASTVASVTPAIKYLRFGATNAQNASALGTDSLAIGGNAYATQAGSLAFGRDAVSSGVNSVSIGLASTADGKNSVALGQGSSADGDNVVSVGNIVQQRRITNVAVGTSSTDAVNLGQVESLLSAASTPVQSQQMVKGSSRQLVGAQAATVLADVVMVGTTDKLGSTEATGTDAVAMGLGAHASNDNTVAVGTNVSAGGVGAVAVGNIAVAGGTNATAIGINAQANGDTAVSIGNSTKASNTNAVAIGNGSFVGLGGTNGVAIGNANTVTGQGTVVLGNAVMASGVNSVVLGSGSDGSQANVVSVGGKAAGTQRKIVNVAAGTTATDAVNLSQLTAAGLIVNSSGVAQNAFVAYDSTAKTGVTLGNGTVGAQIHNLVAGVADGDATNVAQLKAMGATFNSSGAIQNSFVAYNDSTKAAISLLGTAGTKISNVMAGGLDVSSMDAVNGSQLFNVGSSTAAALGGGSTMGADGKIKAPAYSVGGTTYTDVGTALTAVEGLVAGGSADAVIYNTSAHDKVTLGKTGGAAVTVANVAAGVANNDAVNVKQLTDAGLIVNSSGVAQNAFVAYDTTAKTAITLGNGTAGAQIHNLVAGTTGTDAVNLSQLTAAGLTVDTAGKATNSFVAYASTAKDLVTLAGTAGTKISNLMAGTTTSDAVNLGQLTAAGLTVDTAGKATNSFVAYSSTAKNLVTLAGTAGTKISNLMAGTTSSDAVNLGQLTAAGLTVDTAGKATNSFVAYSSTAKDLVTLAGTAGTKISNVTAGTTGTDAVNLNQLTAAGLTVDTAGKATNSFVAYASTAKDLVTLAGTAGTKISNLMAGTTGTDAVNLNQLTAAGLNVDTAGKATNSFVAYDSLDQKSVTLGKAGTPVTVTNVAAGVAPTDAVNMTQFNGLSTEISTVMPAIKYLRFGATDAQNASAVGTDSLAIGGNAYATQTGSLAFGRNAVSSGINSVSIGLGSTADGKNSVALGQGSSADSDNVVSVGNIVQQRRITNVAVGTSATDAVNLGQVESLLSAVAPVKSQQMVMGSSRQLLGAQAATVLADVVMVGTTDKLGQAEAVGTDAVAIGLGAHANNDNTVAIGTNVSAGGVGAVAVGNIAVAGGTNATAIGINAQANGDTAVSIGNSTKAANTNAVAIGNGSFVGLGGTNGVAIGNANTVTGQGTVVLGNAVMASGANSVVLGSGSDGSQANVVSVGGTAAGTQRKIVNVAAGTTATDAVNLGQMTTAIQQASVGGGGDTFITQPTAGTGDLLVGSAVAGTHVNFANSAGVARELTGVAAGTANTSAVNLSQLKPVVDALGGNATVDGAGKVTGPTYNVQGGTQATVGDALSSLDDGVKAIDTKIAGMGPGLVTQSAAGADLLVGSTTDGTHVNFAGTSGNRELINVAAGASVTSAVNVGQLQPVVAAFGGGAKIDSNGVYTPPSYVIQNKTYNNAGDAFANVDASLTNLGDKISGLPGGIGLVAQDPTTKTITVGSLTGGTVVDMTGKDGARTITGVAAGSLDSSSVDAVNGAQLNSIGSGLATAIGGGATFNAADGTITQPSFTVGGNPVNNVGDAISKLDTNVTNNYTDLQKQITNIAGGGTANAVAYDTSEHDKLTLGGTAATTTTLLTNLTDGVLSETSTDAVTGRQLNETNANVAILETTVKNISATGSTSIGINGADGAAGTAGPAGANGADAIAMGDNASASGDHAIVIGGGASGAGDGTIAIGGNSSANGKDSIAIGNGATAPANNAVALGAGSVADRDNSVSVGSQGSERQITNVAAGTQGTDAVNLNQMNSAMGGIARKAYSGIAAATALTMIPDVDANKTLSIGIGGGTFQGYAATAIGGTARITQNIKVRVGAGWSAAGTTVGAGASYQW